MTKIICISDTHGFLPMDLPEGDILIHAGDICPLLDHSINFQKLWLSTNFWNWQKEIRKKYKAVVMIAGNHDFVFQEGRIQGFDNRDYPMKGFSGFYYLQDNFVEVCGLKIWGTPWQREFYNWAFNLKESELANKWELIPKDIDVVVCHGPAYGYGDLVPGRPNWRDDTAWPQAEHVGSPAMLAKLEEIQAKLYVCGHIHSGYGKYQHGTTTIVNASLVNEQYKLVNKPIVVEL